MIQKRWSAGKPQIPLHALPGPKVCGAAPSVFIIYDYFIFCNSQIIIYYDMLIFNSHKIFVPHQTRCIAKGQIAQIVQRF